MNPDLYGYNHTGPYVCVGGPLHGQRKAGYGGTLEVAFMEPIVDTFEAKYWPSAAPSSRTLRYRTRKVQVSGPGVDLRLMVLAPEDMQDSEVTRLVKTIRTDILTGGIL